MKHSIRVIVFTLSTLPAMALALERVAWTGEPIPLTLKVGIERRVSFKSTNKIRVGIPTTAASNLTIQIIGAKTWWTARAPIEKTRVIVRTDPGGEIMVFAVSAESEIDETPENIIVYVPENVVETINSPIQNSPGYARLTRWAVQQLYSPLRLRRNLKGVVRHSVTREPLRLFRCGPSVPAVCGEAVKAVPISAWRTPTHYVTAVELTNTLNRSVILDPRELRGKWRTATFVHSKLKSHGDPDSSTIVVLISDHPVTDAIR